MEVLRGVLAGDGTINTREMGELKRTLRLLSSIQWTEVAEAGARCLMCGELVPHTEDFKAVTAVCPRCCFFRMAVRMLREPAWPGSIRYQNYHYTIEPITRSLGPVMTVRFNTGLRVVTHKLACQGTIPDWCKSHLVDNAVVIVGDPYGLGMGVHPTVGK